MYRPLGQSECPEGQHLEKVSESSWACVPDAPPVSQPAQPSPGLLSWLPAVASQLPSFPQVTLPQIPWPNYAPSETPVATSPASAPEPAASKDPVGWLRSQPLQTKVVAGLGAGLLLYLLIR